MRIGSLCTGYGGVELAVERHYGATIAWHAENASAPSRVLAHHHPDVPNLGDFTATDWANVEPVDILTAGFPCQPFSTAGLRRGEDDERHIWPLIVDALRWLHPRIVVLENVTGLLTTWGTFDEPNDRCVCGWHVGRRRVHRGSAAHSRDAGHPNGHGDDDQGATSSSPPAARVRRQRDSQSRRDGEVGGSVGMEDPRRGSSSVPQTRPAVRAVEGGTGPARVGVAVDQGFAAADADRSRPVGRSRVVQGAADQDVDDGREPQRASGGRLSAPAGRDLHCEACGRRVDPRPTRSVVRNGFGLVVSDLAGLGYDARWGVVRASDAGAPHQRARLFVVATDAAVGRCEGHAEFDDGGRVLERHADGRRHDPSRGPDALLADAASVGRERSGPARLGRPGPPHRDPTPADAAGQRRRRRPHVERPDGPQAERSEEVHPARGRDTAWGDYEPAIRRWELVLGRVAPPPTTPGRNGRERLNAELSEWMMGLPLGYVTSPAIGLSRAEQLRTLGNGVVVQQCALALSLLDPQ